MGAVRGFALLAVGALTAVTLSVAAPTAGAGPAVPNDPSAQPGQVVAAPEPLVTARQTRRYWTPERMAAAVPIEELVPSLGGAISSYDGKTARVRQQTARPGVHVPRTAGKLFFRVPGGDAVCSAAAITTPKRNQVITAGHCVHSGPGWLLNPPHFYSDWLFVPRYRNGRAPLGRWVSDNAFVFSDWIERESFRHDQAIITFKRRNGRRLVDKVGGNEVVWGKGPQHRGVRIWGWPAESPYDGESARRCDGPTRRFERSDAAMYRCDLTGGASGGPWLLPRGRTANTGQIWAVTSRRLLARPVLLASPIPREIRRMIRAANR